MGTIVFLAIHVIAALATGGASLILTIPLHLIYLAVNRNKGPDTSRMERCPACQEYAHMDATVCPHCRGALVPYFEKRRRAQAAKAAQR